MVGLGLPNVYVPVRAARVILQGPATEAWTRSPYTSRAVSRYSYQGVGRPFLRNWLLPVLSVKMPINGRPTGGKGWLRGKSYRENHIVTCTVVCRPQYGRRQDSKHKEPRQTEPTSPGSHFRNPGVCASQQEGHPLSPLVIIVLSPVRTSLGPSNGTTQRERSCLLSVPLSSAVVYPRLVFIDSFLPPPSHFQK